MPTRQKGYRMGFNEIDYFELERSKSGHTAWLSGHGGSVHISGFVLAILGFGSIGIIYAAIYVVYFL